jgi:hypothetical protein
LRKYPATTGESAAQIKWEQHEMNVEKRKNFLRAFWDYFVLFSGISTASNLSRTQQRPVSNRGFFLFRRRARK